MRFSAKLAATSPKFVIEPSMKIDTAAPRYGNGIKWHKMWCDIYDNSKFKAACPAWRPVFSLAEGLKETISHYRCDPGLMVPDEQLNAMLDKICEMRS